MTVALWFAVPARRQIIVWPLAMFIGALAAFSGVFASFVNITGLGEVIGYTADDVAGRYLLPVLLAWFATMMTMFFAELPSSTSISSSPGANAAHQHRPGMAPAGRERKNKTGKQQRRN